VNEQKRIITYIPYTILQQPSFCDKNTVVPQKTSQSQHFYASPGIWCIVTYAQQIPVGKEGTWMIVSDCCGAATKVEYRPDRPFVYDDRYELLVPMLVCTKCEKIIGLHADKSADDPEP
jgi:hypothetical protein